MTPEELLKRKAAHLTQRAQIQEQLRALQINFIRIDGAIAEIESQLKAMKPEPKPQSQRQEGSK